MAINEIWFEGWIRGIEREVQGAAARGEKEYCLYLESEQYSGEEISAMEPRFEEIARNYGYNLSFTSGREFSPGARTDTGKPDGRYEDLYKVLFTKQLIVERQEKITSNPQRPDVGPKKSEDSPKNKKVSWPVRLNSVIRPYGVQRGSGEGI